MSSSGDAKTERHEKNNFFQPVHGNAPDFTSIPFRLLSKANLNQATFGNDH